MKLAFVGGFLNIKGGGERFTLEVAKRFMKRGIEVKIFCHEYDPTKTYPEFHEIPIESINARTHFFGRFAAYFGLKNMEKLVLKADKWGADIIFLQIGYIFSDYLQKLTKKKIISYAHIQEGFGAKNESKLRNIYRKLLGISENKVVKMDQVPIICNSEHTKRLLKSRFPTANIVEVVYPGIDLDKFKPTWEDQRYLFYHSRYEPRKNQMLLIEIAPHIKYPLFLAGCLDKRFKDYYTQLTAKAPSNVTILTNLSDEEILSYLQKCSVYLFPALDEHFGIAIVEAMACGKPVIGHSSGATPEVIDDAGYVCGDDHKEWVEKIDLLMKNQELRADLSKKAYQRAQKFGWENMVSTLEKIFYSYLQ